MSVCCVVWSHAGNQSTIAECEALCAEHAGCNCLSFTTKDPEGRASSTCKLFKGVTELRKIDHRDACVRADSN